MKTLMDLADAYAAADATEHHSCLYGMPDEFQEAIEDKQKARAALEQRIKALEADAKRLDWMERQDWNTLDFLRPIDAPHDSECGVWSEDAGNYMFGKTVREAIDRAMSEAALDKMREMAEELKLP